ncbi:zinc finger MYM-type protein 1-like [Uloborus diversus]|uniref:zinc finger MYM-type protein 1-like n=1 Tax=Uloborus diversus TaxID=327109 RepID=UPI0024096258|nr:zinc finger MYM-type protein 1-like [Uloborus diversus]
MRFCEEIKELRNALSFVNSLYNLINASAKRFAIFENICKKSEGSVFRRFCSLSKTRWTVRHHALSVVIENLQEIIQTLLKISDDSSDVKIASQADGLLTLVTNFEFIFCLKFLFRVLSVTDILSKEIQSITLDISSFFSKVEALLHCLSSERNDEYFKRIWEETEDVCNKLSSDGFEIRQPHLHRKRKVPRRLDDGNFQSAFFPTSTEEAYKVNIYYQGLDTTLFNLRQRFSENDYSKIKVISDILLNLKDPLNESSADRIKEFYKMKFEVTTQLRFYHNYAKLNFNNLSPTLSEFVNSFLKHNLSTSIPSILELLEVARSWPITTANAERSFSTLRRLKTYLRTTMGQDRLSGLALMAVEQEVTAQLMEPNELDNLVEKFASSTDRRLNFY